MMRISTFALASAIAVLAGPAMAQDRVEVGVLDCRGSTTSFVVGSVTNLSCSFRPGTAGGGEPYHATMRRAGLDIGFNQQIVVAWAVFAPSRNLGRGALQGSYVGAAASATVGVGVGANALVGGSNNTIALQPVSVQGQTGLSVAAGIASLELRAGR
jgi:hypothetical protein